jgi:starvation-inducible DNA-binding protein
MESNSGPGKDQINSVVTMLNLVLADECLLYSKTRNCDWTVTSPEARALHDVFEQQYDRLAGMIDQVTQHIRSLGAQAMGTMSEFLQYARLKEHPSRPTPPGRMIAHLLDDHETLLRALKGDAEVCREEFKDAGTTDLLNGLIVQHEDMARVLRARLEHS